MEQQRLTFASEDTPHIISVLSAALLRAGKPTHAHAASHARFACTHAHRGAGKARPMEMLLDATAGAKVNDVAALLWVLQSGCSTAAHGSRAASLRPTVTRPAHNTHTAHQSCGPRTRHGSQWHGTALRALAARTPPPPPSVWHYSRGTLTWHYSRELGSSMVLFVCAQPVRHRSDPRLPRAACSIGPTTLFSPLPKYLPLPLPPHALPIRATRTRVPARPSAHARTMALCGGA
jgi:hypothetical protein